MMEEEISRMKNFLKDYFNNEQLQSPTSEEATRLGSYSLDLEDVSGHVIDWVINYLDNRKCPYSLAVSIAKEIALQISASLAQNDVENFEKMSNPNELYSKAVEKISAVCTAFSNQDNLEPISSIKYSTSVFAIRNKRRKMEDRHVILHDLNAVLDLKDAPYQSYYAVFDGHSGIDAACYASAQLHVNIGKHPDFLTNTPKAIIEGYHTTDKNFINRCSKLNIKSGCTALSALIRNNTIYLSWLGDSQAVLVKGGVPIKITSPHKPDREDERQRIEELGGHISHLGTWRVNGLLAVTRAIGDPDQKPFISCEPELDIVNLDGNEDFLILACDGLWDGISPEDASNALYRYLADSSPDDLITPVAAKLVHQSKIQGSEDNISAIVVFLRDVKDIIANIDNFLSKSSYFIQNHDFISMNGNMKMFSMDSNTDALFSKPTVLELNAASSKKLKNSANVMSSAGFGSTSYGYQFVENLEENLFQSLESSSADSSHIAYMSQASHSASCFAPEATALSELPTPPIDDMLASQQFDNFCSTDLYKELNNSVQVSEQHLVSVDKSSEFKSNEPLASNVEVSSDMFSNIVADAENESLFNIEKNSCTISSSALSSDEAVGIASELVSSTIETAVKCLSEESSESSTVQNSTKLNPYAKPFVMKSFFNTEESDSMNSSFIGSLDYAPLPGEVANTKLENQPIAEIAKEIDTSSKDLEIDHSSKDVSSQSNIDHINVGQLASEQPEQNSDKLPLEIKILSNESESKFTDCLNVDAVVENVDTNHLLQNVSNINFLGELKHTNETPNVSLAKYDDINMPMQTQISDVSQLRMDLEKLKLESSTSSLRLSEVERDSTSTVDILLSGDENKLNLSSTFLSENPALLSKQLEVASVGEGMIQSVNFESLIPERNQKSDISAVLSSDDISSTVSALELEHGKEQNIGNIQKDNEVIQSSENENIFTGIQIDQSQIKATEQMLISETISLNSVETIPNLNQNSGLSIASDKLSSGVIENDIKSKEEQSIVDAVIKNENSESSSIVEPISLISNIKDELISAESEVPSDPSVEDSRIEAVAVDLKSLPEGIPEAEGVTEDVDSDSEKDGGWSYMKGNIISGSKSKHEEKTSKITKSNEAKSNIATKSKRDISKPSLDVKSKVKTTIVDKTKSLVSDKSRTVSQDKAKSVSDKPKTLTSVDKNKIVGSSDKNRKIAVEKKTDVKSQVLKSSATSTVAKFASDKTSKTTAVSSSIRKETSETTVTATATKPTRPTTLLRTYVPAAKTTSSNVTDKTAPSTRTTAKPKTTQLLSENKPVRQNVTTSVTNKGSASIPNKSTGLLNRTSAARPSSAVVKTSSTIARTTVQKPAASETKPKLPFSSFTTARKPLSAATKKSDVKEVKNSVNKQILAKKTATASRIESNVTQTSKRVISSNKQSASLKPPSAAKTEINKRGVPKITSAKSEVKKTDLKISSDDSKNKEKIIESIQDKTDEPKNNSNVESDLQNVTEAAQAVEEKFILETNDKEIPKDVQNISSDEQIVENGSLTKTVLPDEVAECNPENM